MPHTLPRILVPAGWAAHVQEAYEANVSRVFFQGAKELCSPDGVMRTHQIPVCGQLVVVHAIGVDEEDSPVKNVPFRKK